jgi:hypothetical protein
VRGVEGPGWWVSLRIATRLPTGAPRGRRLLAAMLALSGYSSQRRMREFKPYFLCTTAAARRAPQCRLERPAGGGHGI